MLPKHNSKNKTYQNNLRITLFQRSKVRLMTDGRQTLFHTSVNVFDNSGHSGYEIQHSDWHEGIQSNTDNNVKYRI